MCKGIYSVFIISNLLLLQVDSVAFRKVIEWLYSGQVKLTIPECDDALRLSKHCKLDNLTEEIELAINKANSFGKYTSYRIENINGYKKKSVSTR